MRFMLTNPILYGWGLDIIIFSLIAISLVGIRALAARFPEKPKAVQKRPQNITSVSKDEQVEVALIMAVLAREGVALPQANRKQSAQAVRPRITSEKPKSSQWKQYPARTRSNWGAAKFNR